MAECKPLQQQQLPVSMSTIITPLLWTAWDHALQRHPDQTFAKLVVSGIWDGFRIGFNHIHLPSLLSCKRNMGSAYEHPSIVQEYIMQEVAMGRLLGPFSSCPIQHLHTSSFGVIPKRHQWRLIVDLSSPVGHSVNDGVDASICSVAYISVDDIAAAILHLGPRALMASLSNSMW